MGWRAAAWLCRSGGKPRWIGLVLMAAAARLLAGILLLAGAAGALTLGKAKRRLLGSNQGGGGGGAEGNAAARLPDCKACNNADPCFEARIQQGVITDFAVREQRLLEVYQRITHDCATGRYAMRCVTEVFFADDPDSFLTQCELQLGAEPANTYAVCDFAHRKVTKLDHAAKGWGTAKWIIDQVVMDGHCETVPYECIAMISHCLDTTSVRFCFNECLREGQMNARVGWL